MSNELKTEMKKTKISFYQKAFFSKHYKEIWKQWILNPIPTPNKADRNNLN